MTEIYLMQHGDAVLEQENSERPLSDTGRIAVQRVSSRAEASGVRLTHCYHSGKLRALQSAELLSAAVGGELQQRDGLAPNDPVAPAVAWLREVDEMAIALVGHLPFLDRLASALVAGTDDGGVVRFTMGGLTCLVRREHSRLFSVAWSLTPEIA